MAIDKAVDSAQLNGAMTATANAIRAAGGTTGSIAWNQTTGFANAVSNLGGGFYPSLLITAPTGHTITATHGTDTVTLTEISEGQYWGEVTDYGEWTVSGDNTPFTEEFNITKVAEYTGEVLYVSTTLNDNEWKTISAVSQAGTGANYWSIGDAKQITISGTVGLTDINWTGYAFILGFDHNSAKEGTNLIHFQIGRTASAYSTSNGICFVDSTYGNYNANNGSFTMNPASSSSKSKNAGGWNASHMRKTLLGSDKSPTSPGSNTFLAALPSDLRAVMKPVTKYTDNTGGGIDTASYVTETTDYLFLLSEFEVQGTRTRANSAEQTYQAQYKYYADGNRKIRYCHSDTTSAARWWLRSPRSSNATDFCRVDSNAVATSGNSGVSFGVAPGFAV